MLSPLLCSFRCRSRLLAAWAYDWLISFNIHMLDQVQKCCLRLCNNSLGLIPLSIWESRTDMVEVYKYLHGHYVSPEPSSDIIIQCRGHHLKLFHLKRNIQGEKYTTSSSVTESSTLMNNIPASVVSAARIRASKD